MTTRSRSSRATDSARISLAAKTASSSSTQESDERKGADRADSDISAILGRMVAQRCRASPVLLMELSAARLFEQFTHLAARQRSKIGALGRRAIPSRRRRNGFAHGKQRTPAK